MGIRLSLEGVQEISKLLGFTLINEKYENVDTLLYLKCDKCNKKMEKTYRNLRKRPNCKHCHVKRTYTDSDRKEVVLGEITKKKLKLLNENKIMFKSRDTLTLMCVNQHIFNKTVKDFIATTSFKTNGCPQCAIKSRTSKWKITKKEVELFLNSRGCCDLIFLDNDNYFLVEITLPCGHTRKGSVRGAYYSGGGLNCDECNINKIISDKESTLKYLRNGTHKFRKILLENFDLRKPYAGKVVVHHKTAFINIVKKLCYENGIPFHLKIEKYDKPTILKLRKLVSNYHNENAFDIGIVLPETVHIEFHKQYGWYGATEESLINYLKNNDMYDEYF